MKCEEEDICLSCKYHTQACAYILDGNRFEDACMSKRLQLRRRERLNHD